jgi:hypothetical protein
MSHVDEGTLHAYLDGALDELPFGDAQAIREHIATCPECSARLEEEQQIREDAITILSGALPHVELPPLEELRLRAEATSPPRASRSGRLHRMGWAASVMLAVGAGWMLRGDQVLPFSSSDGFNVPAQVPSLPPAPPVRSERDGSADEPSEQAASPVADRSSAASVSVAEAVAPLDVQAQSRRQIGDQERLAFAPSAAIVTDPARRVGFQLVAAREPVAFRDLLEEKPSPPVSRGVVELPQREIMVGGIEPVLPTPSLVATRSSSDGGVAPQRDEREAPQGRVVSNASRSRGSASFANRRAPEGRDRWQDSGRRRGGVEGQLVVPGFELIFMEAIEVGSAAGGLRVVQRLTPGDTLELLHLPEGVQPSDLPAPGDEGLGQFSMSRDGLWVVARARRSGQELEVLLERLDNNR